MKKLLTFTIIATLAIFSSCTSYHGSYSRGDSMYLFCEGVANDYKHIVLNFKQFQKDGKSDVEFVKESDNCWRVRSTKEDSYLNSVTMKVESGSVISFHVNGYILEDEFTTRIVTLGSLGVRDGNGTINIQVTRGSAHYGGAEIKFTDGEPKTTLEK